MWRLLLPLLINSPGICKEISTRNEENHDKLTICVADILTRFYEKGSDLTYVDINSDDNEILKVINDLSSHLIISRTTSNKQKMPHEGYVINAGNSTDFINNFTNLRKEISWNPSAKFLIIIKNLLESEMHAIFNVLLEVHVTEVIVINGKCGADVYTYNPFENYACGKYYERIVKYGPCSELTKRNLYPNKLTTGLRNCTFTIAVPHLPPYTMFPSKAGGKKYMPGTEQYAFEILSELEQFKINYSYVNFAETFSMVDSDMKAVGFFNLLQTNQADVLLGFTVLTVNRGTAFDFLYAHLAFTDELTYIVKKAGNVPVWMNMYLEFHSIVWILLLISFASFSFLILYLLRTDDKVSVILKLWDSLLLHGYSFRCRFTVKMILIIWVWFAYLMNSFYQSSLVSLTTYPSKSYQVSREADLTTFVYRPCISPTIQNFLSNEAGMVVEHDTKECKRLIQGIRVVSNAEGLYTVTPLSIYEFNAYQFLDTAGQTKVFHFPEPVMKIIYAIFMYKGFPMFKRLHKHTLYLRESGLIDRHSNNLYYEESRTHYREFDVSFKAHIIVPWNLLMIGCAVATVTFIIEVLCKRVLKNVQ